MALSSVELFLQILHLSPQRGLPVIFALPFEGCDLPMLNSIDPNPGFRCCSLSFGLLMQWSKPSNREGPTGAPQIALDNSVHIGLGPVHPLCALQSRTAFCNATFRC